MTKPKPKPRCKHDWRYIAHHWGGVGRTNIYWCKICGTLKDIRFDGGLTYRRPTGKAGDPPAARLGHRGRPTPGEKAGR